MRSAKDRPQTRVKKPEPTVGTDAWLIWAAWADRITFEEIKEKTGLTESNVIKNAAAARTQRFPALAQACQQRQHQAPS